MAGILHMAKATQKTLSEPKINDYILLNLKDGLKKKFNNESINFSQNWASLFQLRLLMKITTLIFVEKKL